MIHPLRLLRALLCAVFVAVAVHGTAADNSLEARLARIEAQLARLESHLADTVTADELAPTLKDYSALSRQLGWDGKALPVTARAAGKEQKLSIGGYVQAQAEFGGAPDSRFTGIHDRVLLRRARLTVKGSFAEAFEFTLQPEFGNSSIAGVAGYRAQLADAYLAWTRHEAWTIQIGQFKTPFGYEQLLSDTKIHTIERSLPNDSLTVGRQMGVSVGGTVLNKRLTYMVGAFNGNGTNNGANDNDQFMYAGRVSATAWTDGTRKLAVGVNGYSSYDNGTFTGRRTGWGVDTQFTAGRAELDAEYLHVLSNRLVGANIVGAGWSVQGSYFLKPKLLQAVARYETLDTDTALPTTTTESWVFGLNYLIKGDDLKLSLNYLLGDPAGPLAHEGRVIARLQVVF